MGECLPSELEQLEYYVTLTIIDYLVYIFSLKFEQGDSVVLHLSHYFDNSGFTGLDQIGIPYTAATLC